MGWAGYQAPMGGSMDQQQMLTGQQAMMPAHIDPNMLQYYANMQWQGLPGQAMPAQGQSSQNSEQQQQ